MLTNFTTIRKSIKKLKNLEKMAVDGTYDSISKKEILNIERSKAKLEKSLGGIKNMTKLPGAVFIIDPNKEAIVIVVDPEWIYLVVGLAGAPVARAWSIREQRAEEVPMQQG